MAISQGVTTSLSAYNLVQLSTNFNVKISGVIDVLKDVCCAANFSFIRFSVPLFLERKRVIQPVIGIQME